MSGVGRAALVTGANRGLGREVAQQLCARGYYVFLGVRDPARGVVGVEEFASTGAGAEIVALDVTDPASVAAAVERVGESGRGLDVLVNNAGRIIEATATKMTAAQMRAVYETNVFGVVEVSTAFLPLLARSPAPRIVNVTSTTASLSMTATGHDFGGNSSLRMAYSSSKTALNMITVQLAAALRADPAYGHVKVNCGTPGFVATGAARKSAHGSNPGGSHPRPISGLRSLAAWTANRGGTSPSPTARPENCCYTCPPRRSSRSPTYQAPVPVKFSRSAVDASATMP